MSLIVATDELNRHAIAAADTKYFLGGNHPDLPNIFLQQYGNKILLLLLEMSKFKSG